MCEPEWRSGDLANSYSARTTLLSTSPPSLVNASENNQERKSSELDSNAVSSSADAPTSLFNPTEQDVISLKVVKCSKSSAQICVGKPSRSVSPYLRRSQNNLKAKDICTVMEASSSSSATSTFAGQTKPVCGVCADRAKSYHFGGFSCDSCKAFFRRAVQNEGYRNFRCSQNHGCVINMKTRKSCQSCRFEKCISIGMEIKWVMSDEERLIHNFNRSSRSKGGNSGTVPGGVSEERRSPKEEQLFDPLFVAKEEDMLKYMSAAEKREIESIIEKYELSYQKIPYNVSNTNGSRHPAEIIKMFTTILRRFVYFSKSLPDYEKLCAADQQNLLRAGVLEMCLLRGAFVFDLENNHWPRNNIQTLTDCPRLRLEDMQKLVSSELYEMHKSFINGIQKLKADEPTVMLLLLVVLFYPDRVNVEDNVGVNQSQEKFIVLLQKYVKWRYGPVAGVKIFPKLLTKLSDLRQLNDVHTEYNLRLAQTDLSAIQTQLGQISLGSFEEQREQPLQQPPPPPPPTFNPAQHYFQNFIQQKIPTLIQNPFAPISLQHELLQARALFQQQPPLTQLTPNVSAFQQRPLHFPEYDLSHHPGDVQFPPAEQMSFGGHFSFPQHSYPLRAEHTIDPPSEPPFEIPPSSTVPFSPVGASQENPSFSTQGDIHQMQEMLESLGQVTDVNLMRHLKSSLSTSALSNLESIFGVGIPPNFDMSTITPEMIAAFTGGSFGEDSFVPVEIPGTASNLQVPPPTHPTSEAHFEWGNEGLQESSLLYPQPQQPNFEINYEQYLPGSESPYDNSNYERIN